GLSRGRRKLAVSRVFEALQQSTGGAALPWVADPQAEGAAVEVTAPPLEFEATNLDGVPLLPSTVPLNHRLVALTDERTLGVEEIRVLSARLRNMQQQRSLKKLLITSTMRDEGKSMVAANLAITLARSRQRTLLIDGDIRQRSLEHLLEVPGIAGLTDCWAKGDEVTKYLRRAEKFPLWFMSAGTPQEQPLEMLQSQRMSELLAEIEAWFDWVIIDSPPMLPLADSGVWSALVDGSLFVVREGKTPKKALAQVLQSVDKSKIVGVLMNDCSNVGHEYYYQCNPPSAQPSPKK